MSDDKPKLNDSFNKLARAGHEILKQEQERWNRLTPEQQKAEIRQKHQQTEARNRAKLEKQFTKYQTAFSQWAKRDLWTPEEYAYLLHGEKPTEWDPWPSDGIEETIAIIKRCLGQSLPNTNARSVLKPAMIPRSACLTWWKGYVEPHPFWLRATDEITQAIDQPKTAKAIEARKSTKEIRRHWLQWFLNEMDKRAVNHNWDRTRIPVTKKDIRDVLLLVCPDVQEFSPATLDKELPVFGAKCQPGVKPNVNNVLTKLFAAEIQVNKQR